MMQLMGLTATILADRTCKRTVVPDLYRMAGMEAYAMALRGDMIEEENALAQDTSRFDYRSEKEAGEYFKKMVIPLIIAMLLVAIVAYGAISGQFIAQAGGIDQFLFMLSIFVIGIVLGGIVQMVVGRLLMIKQFYDNVVGRSLMVTERSLPALYSIAVKAAKRLHMKAPDIFVLQDPRINAFALGLFRKIIVFNTAMIESMSEEELLFVMGHELSHIRYGWTVPVKILGISIPLPMVMSSQQREYTCDRGGILASHDLDASILALSKLALGSKLASDVNIREVYVQNEKPGDKKTSGITSLLATHPPIRNRIMKLKAFYESEKYAELVNEQERVP
ncbi:MAG: M48 family metallopeptidase [Caulobacteraceae bacterium]